MSILSSVIFFSFLIFGEANQTLTSNADCDDPNVFNAVDVALRLYNEEKTYGNQFLLYRITEAKIRKDDDGTHHFVTYEVHEGSCGVKSALLWQECPFNTSLEEFTECSAHVYSNKKNISDVYFQNCTYKGVCVDCHIELDPDDPELLNMLQQVINEFNSENNHTNLYNIRSVTEATRKGTDEKIFEVRFIIEKTNCSKTEYAIPGYKCHFLSGESQQCSAQINVTKEAKVYSSTQCSLRILFMGNTPMAVIRGLTPFRTSGQFSRMDRYTKMKKKLRGPRGINNKDEESRGQIKEKVYRKIRDFSNNSDSSGNALEIKIKLQVDNTSQPVTNQVTDHGSNVERNSINIYRKPNATIVLNCPGKLWKPKVSHLSKSNLEVLFG
ncbi:kininogen-1 [Bombina bombina]|uniref:kininogen-1 n=1 Tax=Bombina bombina TaxID=8345 RepID=UPI00235AE704|nr:kininogen-1 [Bombina bombina]